MATALNLCDLPTCVKQSGDALDNAGAAMLYIGRASE